MSTETPRERSERAVLDWECESLAAGLSCYRRGEYFEAHEHWEAVWLTLHEPEKSFLQSLIQTTAAFHHLRRGNQAGAISLLRKALQRLQRAPDTFGGIAVTPLRSAIREWLRMLERETFSSMEESRKIPPEIAPKDIGRV